LGERATLVTVNEVKVDAGRVPLPAEAVRRFGDPAAHEDISLWLFLVDPGHLRLMADQAVIEAVGFDPRRADAMELTTREERHRLAALRMRLFATSIKPPKRLVIPAEAFSASEEHDDRGHVWIDYTTNSVDVYTVSYRRARLAIPPEKLFPKTKGSE